MFNQNTRTIIFLRGIQGCGKSTYRREKLAKDSSYVALSRDDLRLSIWGDNYYSTGGINNKENIVSKMWKMQLRVALLNGYNVILDEMNISPKYLIGTISYIKYVSKIGMFDVNYEVIDMLKKPLANCVFNNEKRKGTWGYVDENIIKKTHKKALSANSEWYKRFAELTSLEVPMKIEQDSSKPKAIIFDLDGTLSVLNGRDPYDVTSVHKDLLNESIYELYLDVKKANRHKIIIVTGRLGNTICREKTLYWLDKHNIEYDEIHFRPSDQATKPDSVIKEAIWKDLTNRYYIDFMVDDRTQVVEHARLCGFDVLQVTFGEF